MEKLMSSKRWQRKKLIMYIQLQLLPVLSIIAVYLRGWSTLSPARVMNIGMDFTGICVLALLFIGTVKDHEDATLRTGTFSYLIMHTAFALFIDLCCWCVDGTASLRWLNIALFTLIYEMNLAIIMSFWQYLVQVADSDDPRLAKLTIILNNCAAVVAVLLLANVFSGYCFYVDRAGYYHRGHLFFLSQFFFVLLIFNVLLLICNLHLDRKKKSVLTLFVTIPFVAGLVHLLLPELAVLYFGVMLSLILIYGNVFAEHSKEIAEQKIDLLLKEKEIAQAEEEHRLLENDLNMGATIQKRMLPSTFPPFPERDEFSIYAAMDPAREVGGDFYDFFLIDDDHVALVIADVSGKGIPAALYMMVAKTMIKNAALQGMRPGKVLEFVNHQLCEREEEVEMFVTVWLAFAEISTGKLVAANAGHEYPAVCRKDGLFELYKDKHCFVLGGMDDIQYKEYELQLNQGDTLLVYTDGVTEATNADKELYGTERMISALNRNPHVDPETLIHDLRSDIDKFVGLADQFDDITMLAFHMSGKEE